MSVDLEWGKLNNTLADRLVEILNRQLSTTKRPSFIGPVAVTGLDFGTVSPDVELVDLCDIYRDFLDDDEEEEDPIKVPGSTGGGHGHGQGYLEDEDGYEWVSRRAAGREEGRAYQHLPPHIRYGRGGTNDLFNPTPSLRPNGMDYWNVGMNMSVPNVRGTTGVGIATGLPPPYYRSPSPSTPFSAHPSPQMSAYVNDTKTPGTPLTSMSSLPMHHQNDTHLLQSQQQQQEQQQNPHPNVQLHFQINWSSNLRLTLTTSLLINYPSPMFMSLPIKLSVTGILFTGEVVVAYEGERKRVHLCILDDLDPYGPLASAERPKRDSPMQNNSSTPPEMDEESLVVGISPLVGSSSTGGSTTRAGKPLPLGQRLLPSIDIESEIGQADKHVLKNVGRVEKFIQDVIRKTVEEELVFPNFHTLVLGDR
ncbi:hypothetical protein AX16_008820 [Volvariella volvacea WC 439]|nr:hypothetical protein AX16_008820 [Volvariella volvacea WC 439]